MKQRPASDVAFSASVKAAQERLGSRAAYRRMEEKGGFRSAVTAELQEFIAERNSFYLATASSDGQPYVQHRGGPRGFLRVLDESTLGFVDYAGNRQYITLGNLAENPRVCLFLMDYANQARVKIWGSARVVEDDPALLAELLPASATARAERVIVVDVVAWDANCRQHIPRLVELDSDTGASLAEKCRSKGGSSTMR